MNSIDISTLKTKTYQPGDGRGLRITQMSDAECGDDWAHSCILKIEGLPITGRPGGWFLCVAPAPVLAWVPTHSGTEWEEILIDESTARDRRKFWNTTELSVVAREARRVVTKALQFREREDPDSRQAMPTRPYIPV